MRQNNPKTKCLDGCSTQEPLVWATNHKGSKMIFELNAHPEGKWILEQQADNSYKAQLAGDAYEGQTYICHWDVCENKKPLEDTRGRGAAPAPRAAPATRPAPVSPEVDARRAARTQPWGSFDTGGLEASVIVNGVTYYGILKPMAQPQQDGLDDL